MCSSIIQSPGVFLVFVAIVTVSLSCILWAKGFFPGAIYGLPSQHPEGPGDNNGLPSRYYRSAAPSPAPEGPSSSNVANSPAASSSSASRPIPPPSPSPLDTGSETEPIPPRKRTNWLYSIIMFLLLLLLFSWMFYPEPVPRSIHHASHIVRALQTIEFCVKWIQIKLSVFQDGRSHLLALQSRVLEDRLLVFLPLAVPLHLAVVILLTQLGRFWRYLLHEPVNTIQLLVMIATQLATLAVLLVMRYKMEPGFRLKVGKTYLFRILRWITARLVAYEHLFSSVEILMTLGPAFIQIFTVVVDNSIRLVLYYIFHLPKAIFFKKSRRRWRRILYHSIAPGLMLALYGIVLLVLLITSWDYGLLATPRSLSPLQYSVFSPLWRRAMRRLFRRLMRRTRKYTIRQATQLLEHLQRIGGLWCSLSIAQQLFTVTPVIVWYGYVYFIPAASRATTYIKIRAAKR